MSIHARGTDPHEPLEAVLRAATAPGHLAELAGEEKAMAAFRAAVPAPRRRSLFARVLTVKVLVVGAVATSTGVVLATAGGVIPIWPEPPAVEIPAPPETTNPASVAPPSGMDETTPETPATTSTTGVPPTPDGSPDQDHHGPGKGDKGEKGDKDGRDRDRTGGFGSSSTPRTTEEHSEEESQTSGPPSSRAETPDSPAHGAVTAVPPNGAVPPTSGD